MARILASTATVVWTFLPVLANVASGRALASCAATQHVQNKFCQADFVVKARVRRLTNETVAGFQGLSVSIKTQIKVNEDFMDLADDALKTIWMKMDKAAPVISSGEKYILSGKVISIEGQNRLVVDGCLDWVELWSQVGHRHKSALRKSKFQRGCMCRVDLDKLNLSTATICGMKVSGLSPRNLLDSQWHRLRVCFMTQGHCILNSKQTCVWTRNRELSSCLTQLQSP